MTLLAHRGIPLPENHRLAHDDSTASHKSNAQGPVNEEIMAAGEGMPTPCSKVTTVITVKLGKA